jgi:hypothetical protein
MARQLYLHNCDELWDQSAVHAIICRCQQAFRQWARATDPDQQNQLDQTYHAALEALLDLLKADLDTMVYQWISSRIPEELCADQNKLFVSQEVVDHLVLNIFTAIVRPLPWLALDLETDVRRVLLNLAERSLYNLS